MSARRKIVIRTVDDDPEKKHRAVRSVLATETLGSSSPQNEKTTSGSVSLEKWLPGAELEVDSTKGAERVPWTLCSVVEGETPEKKNALTSWLNSGAHNLILLSRTGVSTQITSLDTRIMTAKLPDAKEQENIGLADVLQSCDKMSTGKFIVLVNGDVILLNSFGKQLEALLASLNPTQQLLLEGSRVTVREDAKSVGAVLAKGEQSMRREWVTGKKRASRGDSDVLVWRQGAWKYAIIPANLVLGGSGWDAWVVGYAHKHWVVIDGGNVLTALHPLHRKTERRKENNNNDVDNECVGRACQDFFLFRGPCERKGATSADQMRDVICLRRKEQTNDKKASLADMM